MIPDKLEDWNIQIIDCLTSLRDIESETFDFKGADFKELYNHLCAMANTLGGTIVLGIDEVKDQQGHLTKYKKTGFANNKEDNVRNRVNNAMVNVEPIPNVSIRNVSDTNNKFYTVLKVENENSNKPDFVKGSGQCYVRIGASSLPVTRTAIINVFTKFFREAK